MQRQPLFFIIPVLALIAALVLFFQRDNTGRHPEAPSASASGSGLPTGSGANMPPNSSLNPSPAGTSGAATPSDPNSTPGSATQRAPSGEAARPAERR